MRYLVRARVKPGREADLLEGNRATNLGSGLGRRRRISPQHERCAPVRRPDGPLGRSLLLSDAAAGRASVLGRIFRSHARAGCARPAQMPRREWHGILGLRRLRLHGSPRRKTEEYGQAVSDFAASSSHLLTQAAGRADSSSFKSSATSLKLNTSAQKGSMRSRAKGAVARCSRSPARSVVQCFDGGLQFRRIEFHLPAAAPLAPGRQSAQWSSGLMRRSMAPVPAMPARERRASDPQPWRSGAAGSGQPVRSPADTPL